MTYVILNRLMSWTKLKYRLTILNEKNIPYFHEREIWWCSIGANIGFEQDGKNNNFERPVVIIKKFNKHMLWVLPLTSRDKSGKYYHQFIHKGKRSVVILSQLRTISSKRLLRKIGKMPNTDFKVVRTALMGFIKNDLPLK